METADLSALEWVGRAMDQGFQVYLYGRVGQVDRIGLFQPPEQRRVVLYNTRNRVDAAQTREILKQATWIEDETKQASILLGMVPAGDEVKSSPGESTVTNQVSVLVYRDLVDPRFWQDASDFLENRRSRSTKIWQLNRIFDDKVEAELAEDPELLGLVAERKQIEAREVEAYWRKRGELEGGREAYLGQENSKMAHEGL